MAGRAVKVPDSLARLTMEDHIRKELLPALSAQVSALDGEPTENGMNPKAPTSSRTRAESSTTRPPMTLPS
jgi:hypothetical protein